MDEGGAPLNEAAMETPPQTRTAIIPFSPAIPESQHEAAPEPDDPPPAPDLVNLLKLILERLPTQEERVVG
jgi:hypothetical protein